MKKDVAIKLFGSQADMARALGITRQYINVWPRELTQKQIDWVVGAATRLGLDVDKLIIDE